MWSPTARGVGRCRPDPLARENRQLLSKDLVRAGEPLTRRPYTLSIPSPEQSGSEIRGRRRAACDAFKAGFLPATGNADRSYDGRSLPDAGHNREMVGARGFEPPPPCSRSRCATRLRYAPTVGGGLNDDASVCKGPCREICRLGMRCKRRRGCSGKGRASVRRTAPRLSSRRLIFDLMKSRSNVSARVDGGERRAAGTPCLAMSGR